MGNIIGTYAGVGKGFWGWVFWIGEKAKEDKEGRKFTTKRTKRTKKEGKGIYACGAQQEGAWVRGRASFFLVRLVRLVVNFASVLLLAFDYGRGATWPASPERDAGYRVKRFSFCVGLEQDEVVAVDEFVAAAPA